MNLIKIITIIWVASALFSCNTSDENDVEQIDLSNIYEQSISTLISSYIIVPLETQENSYITNIRKVKVIEDKIFVLDNSMGMRSTLYVFGIDGRYISRINTQGHGDMEYLSICDFDVWPGTDIISVLDPGARKIINYNIDAQFVNDIRLSFPAKEFYYKKCKDTLIAIFSTKGYNSIKDDYYDIFVTDSAFNVIYKDIPFKKPLSIAMGNGVNMSRYNNTVSYHKPNTNMIYDIGISGVTPKYTIKFPSKILPGDEIENVFIHGKKSLGDYIYNLIYFESDNFCYSSYMQKKEVFWSLYSKQNNKSILLKEERDPSCNCSITLNIIGAFGDYFIVESDYEKIHSLLDIIDPSGTKCENTNSLSALEGLDMLSNPLLVFIKFDF